MYHQFRPEYIVEHEESLLEHPPGLGPLVRYDVLAPHPEELPPLELLEETQLLDVVVRVALDQPIPQRDELHRRLLQVQRDALSRQGVVTLLVSVMVLAHLQVVGVRRRRVRVQVHEH